MQSQSNMATATQPAPQSFAPTAPPEALLTQIAFGALMSQALYVAAKLGVADLLAKKPRTSVELAISFSDKR